jgi:transcriptional regulator with XRE-family HTH domain
MKLSQYLKLTGITSRRFAGQVDASISAVRKWRQGVSIPRADAIHKISKATKKAVNAADWY